jgi:hypothetical protein
MYAIASYRSAFAPFLRAPSSERGQDGGAQHPQLCPTTWARLNWTPPLQSWHAGPVLADHFARNACLKMRTRVRSFVINLISVFHAKAVRGVRFDDPTLAIARPFQPSMISDAAGSQPFLADATNA